MITCLNCDGMGTLTTMVPGGLCRECGGVGLIDEQTTEATLRTQHPNGHKDFITLTLEEIKLHSQKNKDYAFGGDPLGNFNRVSSILSLYPKLAMSPKAVALVYMLKQLDAALWMLSNNYEGEVEGVKNRLQDVSVYAKLASILANRE